MMIPTAPTRMRLSWLQLVGIQFGLIARSGRWFELIGGAVALYVLAVFGPVIGADASGIDNAGRVWGQWALYCVPLVAIWPSLVWRGEPLGRRYYHWSLPVPRGAHDLARIAAGGLWVVVLVAMLAAGSYVSIFPLERIANPQPISDAMEFAVGLLTLYCVASVLTLVVAHPARWLFGTLTVYLLLWTPMSAAPTWVFKAWGAPVFGRYGLLWATVGAGSSGERHVDERGNTITTWGGDKFGVTITKSDSTTESPGHSGTAPHVERIDFAGPDWRWAASTVWVAASIGAMLLVAARRRER